ncbi:MAG: sulfatase-like hydrolase/transferase [Sedimentisphaerales bacterium]|nr:sulfatase-like hydrolase/transferase [Sedimentisphaerales bacterium]
MNNNDTTTQLNRRDFIKLGSRAATLLATAPLTGNVLAGRQRRKPKPKNIVLIITDQQHCDTISAGGCRHVRTPALDRLKNSGVSFTQSYSANPLCSPARSAIFSGRTSCECAVQVNGRPIRSDIPNLGQWFSEHTDYETFYAGKWHLPRTYTSNIPGFKVVNTGIGGFGYLCDTVMSRACEGFLRNRSKSKPFLLVASFMQPHDICEWLRLNMNNPGNLRYPELAGAMPELPNNFEFDENEPDAVRRMRQGNEPFKGKWDKEQWRYYRWSYYRNIEYVDAEIGRVLQALEDSGHLNDTLIVMTADHGEGMGHHQMVRKSSFYDESVRVPLLFSWPGHVAKNKTDTAHLASGLDMMPTLCDYAGIQTPAHMRGASLRSILEENGSPAREFIVSEVTNNTGRMVRTEGFKYIAYQDNPTEQLFDMKTDPGETKNLAVHSRSSSILIEHRKLLKIWENQLDVPSNVPNAETWRHRG